MGRSSQIPWATSPRRPASAPTGRTSSSTGCLSRRMNRLVEQMLEASRLEEGRLELKLETSDLLDLVRAAIEETRPLGTPIHKVALKAPSAEVTVKVDRQRVTTIVSNLISNAIKYS